MSAKFLFILVLLSLAGCNSQAHAQNNPGPAPAANPATSGVAALGTDPAAVAAVAPADDSDDIAWPRTIKQGGTSIVVYQPQIDKWEQDKLSGRAAVAVTPAGGTKESFGVIEFTARTEVDKDNHIVT